MSAALLRYCARWRSTQLSLALILTRKKHFQKGGLVVSRIVRYGSNQVNISAYSLKQLGNFFGPNRSRISRSFAFACSTNFFGGRKRSSSFQCTAICASLNSVCSVALVFFVMVELVSVRGLGQELPGSYRTDYIACFNCSRIAGHSRVETSRSISSLFAMMRKYPSLSRLAPSPA